MTAPTLQSLLRLLDDETAAVRRSVKEALAAYHGDVSGHLAEIGADLSERERQLLSGLLAPGRRERLLAEWEVPATGWVGLGGDWARVEGLLRAVSDFLHDGLTLRPPVADGLDLLAWDYEAAGLGGCPLALGRWLFGGGRLAANEEDFHAPENSDLAWVLAQGRSNPLGLSLAYILTARRLGMEVEGCAFPARFLCRVRAGGRTWIIDCYERGRRHDLQALLARDGLTVAMRRALVAPVPPGAVVVRLLRNLHDALTRAGRATDARLVRRLLASLHVEP